jgi:hypothetical protein
VLILKCIAMQKYFFPRNFFMQQKNIFGVKKKNDLHLRYNSLLISLKKTKNAGE